LYLPLAIAALATSNLSGARDVYGRMAGLPEGQWRAAVGLADVALYSGNAPEAEDILTKGIAKAESDKSTDGVASSYTLLAEAYETDEKLALAIDARQRALRLSRNRRVLIPVARMLVRVGHESEATLLADELDKQSSKEGRAYAKLIEGEIAYQQHDVGKAVQSFHAAQGFADLWLAQYDLGVAYVESGDYPNGLATLETCQKRRGEAAIYLDDDNPSFRYLSRLPYWIARANEGLGIKAVASEQYRKYLGTRSTVEHNAITEDARRRLGQLSVP